MSDIIKRNWLIVVITLVTLAVNGGLVAMSFVMGGKVAKERKSLEAKRLEVEKMKKYQYGMTEANKALALKNASTAWEYYNKAFDQVVSKYGVAIHKPALANNPPQVVRFVRERCRSMKRELKGNNNIELGGDVENFTFKEIRTGDDLPPLDDVPFIVKNIIVVDAIVEVLSNSGITHLQELTRSELRVKDSGDVYKYLTFNITVKGNFDSIRNCVNGLHNGKFLFIARKVDMSAEDIVNSLGKADGSSVRESGDAGRDSMDPSGPKRTNPASVGASKEARIAFKKMASITANIEFDYVELVRKSETGN
jgi:hypothetical protein